MAPKGDEEEAHIAQQEKVPLLDKDEDCCLRRGRELRIIWCLLILLIAVGVVGVKMIEGWQVTTALYVIVQIVTTVGYGDFTVTKDETKLFCACYVILLLVFGAYAFNIVFSWLHDHSMFATRKRLRVLEARFGLNNVGGNEQTLDDKAKELYGDYNEFAVATLFAVLAIVFGTVFYATYESCTCSYGKSHVEGCKLDNYDVCIATGGYKKSWMSAFYMSVITLTTVGFGDHSPRSKLGRCVGAIWMLIGVGLMANWFASLTKVFLDMKTEKKVVCNELSEKRFKKADKDANGFLTKAEFQRYFLVENGLVRQKDLDLIDEHFDRLDVGKNNSVTFAMVEGGERNCSS